MHLVELIPCPDTSLEVIGLRLRLLRPPSGQRRRPLQGHAELHRQPHRQLLRRNGSENRPSKATTQSKKSTSLTGPLIGLPNSASFRLLDIVGLDVWANVGTNLYHAVPDDPWRDRFLMPEFHNEDDQARLARRKIRPGILQARRQRKRDPRHRSPHLRISPGHQSQIPLRRSRAQYRRPRRAPATS